MYCKCIIYNNRYRSGSIAVLTHTQRVTTIAIQFPVIFAAKQLYKQFVINVLMHVHSMCNAYAIQKQCKCKNMIIRTKGC